MPVEAYVHSVSDYVNAALDSGLEVVRLGEWQDELVSTLEPRLLSALFRRPHQ